jgi:hypothetical protein
VKQVANFAGGTGCRKTTSTTCELEVTAATEATNVFLKEGKEGPAGGEGPAGRDGSARKEGKAGVNGTSGQDGAAGGQGEKDPAGPIGGQGLAGAHGPAGLAGRVELVACKKVGKKQKCTTKLVSGTVNFTATGSPAQVRLSRHGGVYTAGNRAQHARAYEPAVAGGAQAEGRPLHAHVDQRVGPA